MAFFNIRFDTLFDGKAANTLFGVFTIIKSVENSRFGQVSAFVIVPVEDLVGTPVVAAASVPVPALVRVSVTVC